MADDARIGRRDHGSFPGDGNRAYHGYDAPLPGFPALTHVNECIALPGAALAEHRHPAYELVYIHAGVCHWRAGDEALTLRAGDLWITRPGEAHEGRADAREPQHDFAVGLDPARLPLAGRLAPERDVAQALAEADVAPAPLARRVIPGARGIETVYRRILAELDRAHAEGERADLALTALMVQSLLVELLVWAARADAAARAAPAAPAPTRGEFQRLLAWLPARLAEPPTLAEMADFVGLSPAHFASVFRRETGRSPLEYTTALRTDEAARRLAGGDAPVGDIALDLGFGTAQYFAVVFRRAKGCSPSEWRRRHRG